MSTIPEPYLALDEYYILEEQGEQRHEYFRGRIFKLGRRHMTCSNNNAGYALRSY